MIMEVKKMRNFVPFEKMSKKKKREINNMRRNSWGDFNPTTRVAQDSTKYSRAKSKRSFKKEVSENY